MDINTLAQKNISDLPNSLVEEDLLNAFISGTKWEIGEAGMLILEIEMSNFKTALEFVNELGDLAEAEGHHPDISIYSYKNVRIELFTHDASGLTEKDLVLAAKILEI